MKTDTNNAYFNIKIETGPLVEDLANLIFTLEGTTQVFSQVYAKQLDQRLPDIQLYQYQAKVYQAIKSRNNILVVSGTGSGKTEACFFPLLSMLKQGVFGQILSVYPTNVLARQQQQRLQEYSSWFGLTIHQWSGETMKDSKNPEGEIITTNPNFLLENFKKKKRFEQFNRYFKNLEAIIFDEIHMYDARQIALMTELLQILNPKQIIFLSATVGNLQEVAQTISDINNVPTEIFRGSSQKATTQYIVLPDMSQMDLVELFLQYLYEPGMTLVFTQTIAQADQLRRDTIYAGLQSSYGRIIPSLEKREEVLRDVVTVHHSGLAPEERITIEDRLKRGSMLVFSPKTLAQGIDVSNVIRVVHLGLPNSLADFLQREGRAGRRKETKWTESIIICKNTYDELILSNKASFEAYIKGTPERILLLPESPIAKLFLSAFKFNCLPLKVEQSDRDLLFKYNLLEKKNSKSFSSRGQMFWREELSFYGPVRYVYFVNISGKPRYKPDRISKEDLFLKFQPNTLHFKYGVLQRVTGYSKEGNNPDPVFEVVKSDIMIKLFKHNSLRSNVVKQIVVANSNTSPSGIGYLKILPVKVTLSFLRTDCHPPEYEIYQTFPADMRTVLLLTTYLTIPFGFSPINMEMAVHCFIQALRLTQDIRYSEIDHVIMGKSMLLFESNFSGLLIHLNYESLIESAKEIGLHYLQTDQGRNEVYPLPTCRYIKKDKDELSKQLVMSAFDKIAESFLQMKQLS